MANIRELRDRIRSVNSTKKITKAQELIATSRITKAQRRVADAQPYADEIEHVIGRLASASSLDHPMLHEREDAKRAAVLVVTGDRGMCGGYNTNVVKQAAKLRAKLQGEGYEVSLYVTGKRGIEYYEFREVPMAGTWQGFSQDPDYALTHDVRRHLIDGFEAGSDEKTKWRDGLRGVSEGEGVLGFDQVHVVYTRFVSMLTQEPAVKRILPIEPVHAHEDINMGEEGILSDGPDELVPDYEFEPSADDLLTALLPQYVSRTIFAILLEAAASESASRRTAMKAATDNATELVKDLSRVANQARQAKITQEITEIVGGAGALDESGESD